MKAIFIILTCLFFYCCIQKSPVQKACTEEARAGLTICVKDKVTNQVLFDSVLVVATDGNYSETLQYFSGNPATFSGAWERAGNYVITVSKPRYKNYISSAIVVSKDECHVISQTTTISLQAN